MSVYLLPLTVLREHIEDRLREQFCKWLHGTVLIGVDGERIEKLVSPGGWLRDLN